MQIGTCLSKNTSKWMHICLNDVQSDHTSLTGLHSPLPPARPRPRPCPPCFAASSFTTCTLNESKLSVLTWSPRASTNEMCASPCLYFVLGCTPFSLYGVLNIAVFVPEFFSPIGVLRAVLSTTRRKGAANSIAWRTQLP